MIVRNVGEYKPFRAIDGCEVVEVVGAYTTGTREVSVARARIKPGLKTYTHYHRFMEVYIVIEGSGVMEVGGERRRVGVGDAIVIPPYSHHSIENCGEGDLLIWCICTPAFTVEDSVVEGGG